MQTELMQKGEHLISIKYDVPLCNPKYNLTKTDLSQGVFLRNQLDLL